MLRYGTTHPAPIITIVHILVTERNAGLPRIYIRPFKDLQFGGPENVIIPLSSIIFNHSSVTIATCHQQMLYNDTQLCLVESGPGQLMITSMNATHFSSAVRNALSIRGRSPTLCTQDLIAAMEDGHAAAEESKTKARKKTRKAKTKKGPDPNDVSDWCIHAIMHYFYQFWRNWTSDKAEKVTLRIRVPYSARWNADNGQETHPPGVHSFDIDFYRPFALGLSDIPPIRDNWNFSSILPGSDVGAHHHQCAHCGLLQRTSTQCQCKQVYYCNRGCQKSDWAVHKLTPFHVKEKEKKKKPVVVVDLTVE